jgi:hypothetical protein
MVPSGVARVGPLLLAIVCAARAAPAYTSADFDARELLGEAEVAGNTQAIANRQGFATDGVRIGPPGAKIAAGDNVTALVTLGTLDGRLVPRQWIVRITVAPREGGLPITSDSPHSLTYYTNCADTFVFRSNSTPVGLETLGPVPQDLGSGADLEVKRARISVSEDFLTLDLYRSAEAVLKLHTQSARGPKGNYAFNAGPRPFPPEREAARRAVMESFGISAEDRRALAGALPALGQFLAIVRNAPDLEGILLEAVDLPSVVDVLRHGTHPAIGFEFTGAGPREIPRAFAVGDKSRGFGALSFNVLVYGKRALSAVLFVSDPVAPLEASAGILGVVAFSPSKPDKIVVVRVIAAGQGVPPAGSAK